MVSDGMKNMMMIVVVSAICIILFAYLFGIVFVNVLKEKLTELRLGTPMGMPKQLDNSSLEGFQSGNKSATSEEESHRRSHGTSEEESRHQRYHSATSEEESHPATMKLKVKLSSTPIKSTVKSEEATASITPEAIQQRYRDGLAQLKRDMDAAKEREEKSFASAATGVQEESMTSSRTMESDSNNDDDKIVISKKFLIENFGGFAQVNPNLKPKAKMDEEYMKLFGGMGHSSTRGGPSPDGFAALEQDDQGRSAWNFDYERNDQVRNLCFRNHKHGKGKKECQYGPTNYADPRTMSVIEKRSFILNYPPNMTMQDYVNWLYCFANGGEDQLPYNHLKNLEKLKRGIPLVKEEGVCPPSGKYFPPLDAEKYFQTMYDLKTKEIAFASNLNSTTGPLMGANYNQYSDFAQNMGQFGLSGMVVNPDLAYKKEAKIVDNYIIPKDSSNMENVQGN